MLQPGALKSLSLVGYRGFATRQALDFAQPNGNHGSGLTVIVGPNNAGKSSIIEALRAICFTQVVTFTEGKRNKKAGDRVEIRLELSGGEHTELKSGGPGQFDSVRASQVDRLNELVLALPSRRYFNAHVPAASDYARDSYAAQVANFSVPRGSSTNSFMHRLFRLQLAPDKKREFDRLLSRVLGPVPSWTIDQDEQSHYFVRFQGASGSHSSEGMGDGLLSTLFLVDALYDSDPGQCIIVDEPELSLHPAIQRRLCELFLEYSETRQLVVATHSPYFLPLEAVPNGATVARVFVGTDGSTIRQISEGVGRQLGKFTSDVNNPHVLGLDAREVFFLDDGIILVEGQEDVVFYRRLSQKLGERLGGAFFGWGVGGAEKMHLVAALLRDLGYERVAGVLDGNKSDVTTRLQREFAKFQFFTLPADDIRTKAPVLARDEVRGLFDRDGEVRPELVESARRLLGEINGALRDPSQ